MRYPERRIYLRQRVQMSPGMPQEAMLDMGGSIFEDAENGTASCIVFRDY
jgi:hypothetical protein